MRGQRSIKVSIFCCPWITIPWDNWNEPPPCVISEPATIQSELYCLSTIHSIEHPLCMLEHHHKIQPVKNPIYLRNTTSSDKTLNNLFCVFTFVKWSIIRVLLFIITTFFLVFGSCSLILSLSLAIFFYRMNVSVITRATMERALFLEEWRSEVVVGAGGWKSSQWKVRTEGDENFAIWCW